VRRTSHNAADSSHQLFDKIRQLGCTSISSFLRMACLVDLHLVDYGPAGTIGFRQSAKVVVQVAFDLPLRLLQETQVPAVASETRQSTNRE
jgi:hypothetical protein